MTTTEQFERLYRDASPAMRQRLDDIVTGASICQERKHGSTLCTETRNANTNKFRKEAAGEIAEPFHAAPSPSQQ